MLQHWLTQKPELLLENKRLKDLGQTPVYVLERLVARLAAGSNESSTSGLDEDKVDVLRDLARAAIRLICPTDAVSDVHVSKAIDLGLLDVVLGWINTADSMAASGDLSEDVAYELRSYVWDKLDWHAAESRIPGVDAVKVRAVLFDWVKRGSMLPSDGVPPGWSCTIMLEWALGQGVSEISWYWLEHCPADFLTALNELENTASHRKAFLTLLGPGSIVYRHFQQLAGSSSEGGFRGTETESTLSAEDKKALAQILQYAASGSLPGPTPSACGSDSP